MKAVLDNIISIGFSLNTICPYCHNNIIIKNGKYKGKQRYICKSCNKNFNSLTNTPMSMTHNLDKWPLFISCVVKGLSLRASAKETGVSHVTLFYWRHKIMRAMRDDEKSFFGEHVEVNDIFLTHSEKGSRKITDRKPRKAGIKYYMGGERKVFILAATDHSGHLFLNASAPRNSYTTIICELLTNRVSPNSVFCSGPKSFYKHFAKLMRIKQYFSINHCTRTEKHNIDLANGYLIGVKAWIDKFKGVASKYLNNYLSLFKCLSKINFAETELVMSSLLSQLKYLTTNETYRSIRQLELA